LKAHHRHGPGPSAPPDLLADRGGEALRHERFKDAIELFKQAIRQDPRPEWKESLSEAWRGRARDLAAKHMFKEAALVLENTLAHADSVRDPLLYLTCLIRDGQQPKAAAYFLSHPEAAAEHPDLEAVAAALLVAVPRLPDPAPRATPEQIRWRELAVAARGALEAWCNGAGEQEIDQRLNAISLRSAFRPLRLLLKSLITMPSSLERTRQVLETIPPGSPFYPLRQAVTVAVGWESSPDASAWNRLTPGQQTFVAETLGLSATGSQFLARLATVELAGSRALFDFLIKQIDRPPLDVRNACLNLLPQVPDRIAQFEKSFGAFSSPERRRIQALGAEARGDWEAAGRHWQGFVTAIGGPEDPDPNARLSKGVVLRHLAALAAKHEEIETPSFDDEPVTYFLEIARAADPDHVATYLELIGHYRKDSSLEAWRELADEAVQRFPDDARVLQQALDCALSRKAYKQAEDFARRLLKINSINPGVRRQMIDLQISYARKHMRAKRPDLALGAVREALSWERPDAPHAPLRIVQGLVEGRTGEVGPAEAKLREGVALAGGGVGGWFRAGLEADLMKENHAGWLHQELVRARETPPTADAVLAVVSVAGQPEIRENRKAVVAWVRQIRPWLQQATAIDWKPAEFEAVAEMLCRFDLYDLLGNFAQSARKRDPANPAARFHAIVASNRGNSDNLKPMEHRELEELAKQALEREDFPLLNRISRFLDGDAGLGGERNAPPRHRRPVEAPEELDPGDFINMFRELLMEMPKSAAAELRKQVRDQGHERVLSKLISEMTRSPMGPEMPRPILRMLCEVMLAKAMQDGAKDPGVNRGRGFF